LWIGFPAAAMPGVDLLIPDVTYLKEAVTAGKSIVGMFLSHGHDDHIALWVMFYLIYHNFRFMLRH